MPVIRYSHQTAAEWHYRELSTAHQVRANQSAEWLALKRCSDSRNDDDYDDDNNNNNNSTLKHKEVKGLGGFRLISYLCTTFSQ